MSPSPVPFRVPLRELLIAGISGFIFGVMGYFLARHINNWLEKKLP